MALVVQGRLADGLVCRDCGGYLSVGPVKIVAGKGAVCGRCSKAQKGAPSMFNVLAEHAYFPCNNRSDRCAALLRPAEVPRHERSCPGRRYVCAVPGCAFVGGGAALVSHFASVHPGRTLATNEALVDLATASDAVYLYRQDDRLFYVGVERPPGADRLFCFAVPVRGTADAPSTVAFALRAIDGTVGAESGPRALCSEVCMEAKAERFPRELAVLSFELESERMCPYLVEMKVPPPRQVVKKEEDSFQVAVVHFKTYSGEFSVESKEYKVLGKLWQVVVAASYQRNDRTIKFLDVTVCCLKSMLPEENIVVKLDLLSSCSEELNITKTQTFICREDTKRVFHKFVYYTDIYKPKNGFLNNDTLIFKIVLSKGSKTNTAVSSSLNMPPQETPSDETFPIPIKKFSKLPEEFCVSSKPFQKFGANWQALAVPTYRKSKTEKYLTLNVCCTTPPSSPKETFRVTVCLESNLQITRTQSFIGGGGKTFCYFHNLVNFTDIPSFLINDALPLNMTITRNDPVPSDMPKSVPAPPKAVVFEHTFVQITAGLADQMSSPSFHISGLPWSIVIKFSVVNNTTMLSVYLCCLVAKQNVNWSCAADVKLTLVGTKRVISRSFKHGFHRYEFQKGFVDFAKWAEIGNLKNGFVVNDTITIRAEVEAAPPKYKPITAKNTGN